MTSLLPLIEKEAGFLLQDYHFNVKETVESESFGNAAVYLESPILTISFIRDRSQLFLNFQSKFDKRSEWFSFDLIKKLLDPQLDYYGIMDEANFKFLREHFEEIVGLYSPEKVAATLQKLKAVQKDRTKKMFGPTKKTK